MSPRTLDSQLTIAELALRYRLEEAAGAARAQRAADLVRLEGVQVRRTATNGNG